MTDFGNSSCSSSSSSSSTSPLTPSSTSSSSSLAVSPTSFKFNPEASLFVPQSEGETSDSESVFHPKSGLTEAELDAICQAEWVFYAAGRVKTCGSRRLGKVQVESLNKGAFGPHYKASQLLFEWIQGWNLRDEAHKKLCVDWVRGDPNPVHVPKPGLQLPYPVGTWEVEEVVRGVNASLSRQSQGWDNSSNKAWTPDTGKVRVEAKNLNGACTGGVWAC